MSDGSESHATPSLNKLDGNFIECNDKGCVHQTKSSSWIKAELEALVSEDDKSDGNPTLFSRYLVIMTHLFTKVAYGNILTYTYHATNAEENSIIQRLTHRFLGTSNAFVTLLSDKSVEDIIHDREKVLAVAGQFRIIASDYILCNHHAQYLIYASLDIMALSELCESSRYHLFRYQREYIRWVRVYCSLVYTLRMTTPAKLDHVIYDCIDQFQRVPFVRPMRSVPIKRTHAIDSDESSSDQ